MKAMVKNYRQPPRKVRLVADLIRGKSVEEARTAIKFLPKKAAPAVAKLLESAVANARSAGTATDNLFIKKITVDKGMVMRRYRPFARGRAGTIDKTMSIVSLELGSNTPVKAKKTARKRAASAKKAKTAPAKKTT